ncbi:hypothetical protein [Paenarthrobacter sp. CAP02]|uniref:DUF3846 domain-containing protein n=1 Tax=Paenarthrobacter sp. CAP02 TaxID=3158144 RepID=UPI0032DAF448
MQKFLFALIVPARLHEPIRVEEIGAALASRQSLVEGNVEAISGRGWHAFLNDQAESIPLPLNPRAEVLIREAGTPIEDPVSGNAVFLGQGSDGNETDVPGQLLSLAERLFGTRLAA